MIRDRGNRTGGEGVLVLPELKGPGRGGVSGLSGESEKDQPPTAPCKSDGESVNRRTAGLSDRLTGGFVLGNPPEKPLEPDFELSFECCLSTGRDGGSYDRCLLYIGGCSSNTGLYIF